MSCQDREDLITRHVSGDLAAREREELERHLAGCPSCRQDLTRAQDLERLLSDLPMSAAPEALGEKIVLALDRLEAEELESRIREIIRARRSPVSREESRVSLLLAALAVLASTLSAGWVPRFLDLIPRVVYTLSWMARSTSVRESLEGVWTDPVFLTVITTLLYSLWMALGRPFPAVRR